YILVLALATCIIYTLPSGGSPQPATDGLLRLHVVANSDSPEDQELKLRVKDRIVSEIGGLVSEMKTKEEILEFLQRNMRYIEDTAAREVKDANKEYGVKAEVGYFTFPTKSYGSLALPAGEYQALRIVLGEGGGANWWCVMFPPLCFVDTKNAVALERDQQRVRDMLAGEEHETPPGIEDMGKIPVRVRFKLLEVVRQSGMKLAEVFNGQ
ncbi:MAG: stage II sporulation protein R, partial [Clostridia bacterium]